MTGEQIKINGRLVDIKLGETILQTAKRYDIDIPSCCYSEGLQAEGGCRLCLVETNQSSRPLAACHTLVHPSMEIQTHTPKLERLRHDILALYSSEIDGTQTNKNSPNTRFSQLLKDTNLPVAKKVDVSKYDSSHPYLRFSSDLCITCRLCLNACEQIQGQFVFGIAERGPKTQLIFGGGQSFAESPCVACGACVDVCPTGALSDRDRLQTTPIESYTKTVCGYCGVGCRLEVAVAEGKVAKISGVPQALVNHGHLCMKGRYAHAYHSSADRLSQPLKRVGQNFIPISWQEALELAASELLRIKSKYGSDALGALSSSRSTNEAAYLLQKLFRSVLGTHNVDCCARVCHSSTAMALQALTGTGAASASYLDIERAQCIVVAGANPTEGHPVLGARIKQAALRGTRLIIIDPRKIELADYAGLHLQLTPGTNVPLFNGIAKVLVDEQLVDTSYLEERVEDYASIQSFLKLLSLDEIALITGVSSELIRQAARLIGHAGPSLFVSGLGLSELSQGVASVMSYCNLAMLTGSIGKPGAGVLPLRGQNNVQGNADMGAMPNQFTGYQSINQPSVRQHFRKLWGKIPSEKAGLTIPEMLDAAEKGEIRALWIQGEDVAQSDPNETHVRSALAQLDFLVVQELFLSETAQYAHLVLPAAACLEQEGTFTNGERRIQHVRPAVPPPGEARPDWIAVRDVARAMGADWQYDSPSEVMTEIALAAPHLFGGISYARLQEDGLQWPCRDQEDQGTVTVHAEGFMSGKGKLASIEYQVSPEHGIQGYPFLLITGRLLEHYNVGTMTRRTPNFNLITEDVLDIHPNDAADYKIIDGDRVKLQSRWGEISVNVRLSSRLSRGTLFLSFHFPETHANRLTGPHLDPLSKCPQYKAVAVKIELDRQSLLEGVL
ncbi:MAG: formate dehydrogenase subunit alpha [Proteobacteria bacterium]|nr:formate dehydrogenase subunit alpha [Pseudomonadota bacterium]